jgi:AcrR family transcriptional regulator
MAHQQSRRERRQRILRAAERLLSHYGFAKTTVADIAKEARVGVGTVYLEFSSKEAIVATLSMQVRQRALDSMRACCVGHTSYAERIRSNPGSSTCGSSPRPATTGSTCSTAGARLSLR